MRAFLGVIIFYITEVQDLNISYKRTKSSLPISQMGKLRCRAVHLTQLLRVRFMAGLGLAPGLARPTTELTSLPLSPVPSQPEVGSPGHLPVGSSPPSL